MKDHNLLQEDKKQAKQQELQLIRSITSFPIPRIPLEQINLIQDQNINMAYQEYLLQIPQQYQAIQQQAQEEQPYYSKLDTNQVPKVKEQFTTEQFFQLFTQIINSYMQKYQNIKEYTDEEHIEVTILFRFILQIPYIPPYSTLCKRLFKLINFDQIKNIKSRIRKILKVKVFQEMLQSSLTKRWEINEKFDDIMQTLGYDEPLLTYRDQQIEAKIKETMNQLEYDENIKVCYSNVDYLLSNIFSLVKLLKNIDVIEPLFFGTLIVLFFGSHAYQFIEMRPFLFKSNGLLQWMMRKDVKDFESIYKAGILPKLLIILEYYKKLFISIKDQEQQVKLLNEEIFYLLVFVRKTIQTKNCRDSRNRTMNQRKSLTRLLKDLKPFMNQENMEEIDDIEKYVFR